MTTATLSSSLSSLKSVAEAYSTAGAMNRTNVLLTGDFGTGKTTTCATAPRPILIDSFDPGGVMSVRKHLWSSTNPNGFILADTRYENEDSQNPTAYDLWESTFLQRRREGLFDQIGTYVIDSGTNFSEACMNRILTKRKGGRQDGIPNIQDYQVLILTIRDIVKACTSLKCNFIFTCHLELVKDELSGRITQELFVTGKLRGKLPLLFDEVYVCENRGAERKLLTSNEGQFKARTRLGAGGKFSTREDPDLFSLMKKAGLDPVHKPVPWA